MAYLQPSLEASFIHRQKGIIYYNKCVPVCVLSLQPGHKPAGLPHLRAQHWASLCSFKHANVAEYRHSLSHHQLLSIKNIC